MASRRTERLITAVFTLHDGSTVTAEDTATGNAGSSALGAFKAYKTATVKGENSTTLIPFHSVIKVVVTETTSESEFTDDFCGKVGE